MRFPPSRRVFVVGLAILSAVLSYELLSVKAAIEQSRALASDLARSTTLVYQTEILEMKLVHEEGTESEQLTADLQRVRNELADIMERLPAYRSADIDVSSLVAAYKTYDKTQRVELALLSAGEMTKARKLDEASADPAYTALAAQLREVQHKAEASAVRNSSIGNLQLGALAFTGVAAIGALLFVDSRQRHRTQLLAAKHQAVEESERRFRLLTERASEVVLIVNREATVLYATPSIEPMFGMSAERICGKSLLDLVLPDDRPTMTEHLRAASDGESLRVEFRALVNESKWIYLEGLVTDLSAVREIGGLVINLRDIDDQKRAQTQLLHTALHDTLTGLPNRVLFTERLEGALERLTRVDDSCLAVLFIDIDDFKVINDSVGHHIGDLLIIEVAQRLSNTLRRNDTVGRLRSSAGIVARLGGDEFSVMLDDIHDAADAVRVCERIHAAMRQPFTLGHDQFYASVSIGVAIGAAGESTDNLMRNADVAMYRAKTYGKARYAVFDSHMHERVTARLKLETELRVALEKREFTLYYQPIVSLKTGRIERAEALMRWHRAGKLVLPGEFIPAAEESGLIRPLGHWTLEEACRQAALWNSNSEEPVIACVNISGKQFTHPNFLDEVLTVIAQSGVHPTWLEFEITEGVAMEEAERTRHTLGQLRAIGVRLALDDFGTGYSSLSYLRRFAVNTLKIDRSFVSDLPHNRENLAIVQTIIELANILGIETVAEGIETAEQLFTLQQCGCTLGQGYFFSRPSPAQTPPWPAGITFIDQYRRAEREQERDAVLTAAGEKTVVDKAMSEKPLPEKALREVAFQHVALQLR